MARSYRLTIYPLAMLAAVPLVALALLGHPGAALGAAVMGGTALLVERAMRFLAPAWGAVAPIVWALLILPFAAVAQDALPAVPLVPADSWLGLAQQLLLLIVTGLLIPLGLRMFTEKGSKDTANRLQIEAKHAEWLNIAARNTAALLLDPNLTIAERKRQALTRMQGNAKDAIAFFSMHPDKVAELVESYRAQLTQFMPLSLEDMPTDIKAASTAQSGPPIGL